MNNDGDRGPNGDRDPSLPFEAFSPFNIAVGSGMGPPGVISIQFPSNSRSERRNAALEAILSSLFTGHGDGDVGIDAAFDPLSYIAARSFAMAMNEVNTNPVHQSVIDDLKKVDITQKHLDDGATCPVCLDDFTLDEEDVYSLPCGHMFHKENCLMPWLESHNNCPVCRKEFRSARDDPQEREDRQAPRPARAEAPPTGEEERATGEETTGDFPEDNVNLGLNLLRMIGLPVAERPRERPRVSVRATVNRPGQPTVPGMATSDEVTTGESETAGTTTGSDGAAFGQDTIFRRSAPGQFRFGMRRTDPLQQTIRILQGRSARNVNGTNAADTGEERVAPEPVRSRSFGPIQIDPVVVQIGPRDGESGIDTASVPDAEQRPRARSGESQGTSASPSTGSPQSESSETRSPIDFFVQLAQSLMLRAGGAPETGTTPSTTTGSSPIPPSRGMGPRMAPTETRERMAFAPFPFQFAAHGPPHGMAFTPPQPMFHPRPARDVRITEDGFLEDDILRAIAASLEDSGTPSNRDNQESSAPSTSQRTTPATGGTTLNPNNVLRISRESLPQSDSPVIELATPQPTPVPTSTIDLTEFEPSRDYDISDTESIVMGESDDEEEVVSIPLSRVQTRTTRPRIFVSPRQTIVHQPLSETPTQVVITPSVSSDTSPSTTEFENTTPSRPQSHTSHQMQSPLARSTLPESRPESQPESDSPESPIQSGAGGTDLDHSHESPHSSVSNKRERDVLQAMETEAVQTSEPTEVTINKGYVVGSNNSRSRTDIAQSNLDAVRNAIRADVTASSRRTPSNTVPSNQVTNRHQLFGFQSSHVPDVEEQHVAASTNEAIDTDMGVLVSSPDTDSAPLLNRESSSSVRALQFDDRTLGTDTATNVHENTMQHDTNTQGNNLPSEHPNDLHSSSTQVGHSAYGNTSARNEVGEEKEPTQNMFPTTLVPPSRPDEKNQSAASSPSTSVSSNSPLVDSVGTALVNEEDKSGSCITRTGGSLMSRISDSVSPLMNRLKSRFSRNRR